MANYLVKIKGFAIGIGIVFSITLLIGFYFNSIKPMDASTNLDQVQTQLNAMKYGTDWNLIVEKVTIGDEFKYYDSNKRIASVYLSLQNENGKNEAFLPKGKILGFYGDSGKYYELPWDESLGNHYSISEDARKKGATFEKRTYEPGIFNIVPQFYIDANEKSITKLVYQDEDGVKYDISIQKTTEIPPSYPGGK